ncbi:hypothetical protein VB714_12560, partial [Spirulina sp. 06S082]
MTTTLETIYAPNVRLFTYYLQEIKLTDFTSEEIGITQIQNFYQTLLDEYGVSDRNENQFKLKLRTDFEEILNLNIPNFDLIKNTKSRGIQRINLKKNSILYKGFIYPQFLNDTYSFSITLFYPQNMGTDGVNINDLSKLKPPDLFFLDWKKEKKSILEKAFWGSTIFLSGFIARTPKTPEEGKSYADDCLQKFLNVDTLENAP